MLIKLMSVRARVKIDRREDCVNYIMKLTMLIKTSEVNRDNELT